MATALTFSGTQKLKLIARWWAIIGGTAVGGLGFITLIFTPAGYILTLGGVVATAVGLLLNRRNAKSRSCLHNALSNHLKHASYRVLLQIPASSLVSS